MLCLGIRPHSNIWGLLRQAAHPLRQLSRNLSPSRPSKNVGTRLRARAAAGDRQAAGRLANLLTERGDLDGPRARAATGDGDGDGDAGRLADLLIKQGRDEEAERLRRFGLNPDGPIALE
jgi:hypothetical protein